MASKLSRAFREKSEEISLCSIILNLAEDTNVVLEQKATYVSFPLTLNFSVILNLFSQPICLSVTSEAAQDLSSE